MPQVHKITSRFCSVPGTMKAGGALSPVGDLAWERTALSDNENPSVAVHTARSLQSGGVPQKCDGPELGHDGRHLGRLLHLRRWQRRRRRRYHGRGRREVLATASMAEAQFSKGATNC